MRHVHIQNDSGIGYQTRIFDSETGDAIPNVTCAEVLLSPEKDVRAKLEVMLTSLDVKAVAEVSTICPYCNRAMPYEENQRLILQLTEQYEETKHVLASVKERLIGRDKILKLSFRNKFPDAPKFKEAEQFFGTTWDWKYWFVGITEKHIEWAKAAKECGLIDAYIVDYAPDESEVEE